MQRRLDTFSVHVTMRFASTEIIACFTFLTLPASSEGERKLLTRSEATVGEFER